MSKITPRRPLDDDKPNGYRESDKDFVLNNIEIAVAMLEAEVRKEAKKLWQSFGDTSINDSDEIEAAFLHFPVGTDRLEIWHWFEETYDLSIAKDLMGQRL